jgi:arsenate reductase
MAELTVYEKPTCTTCRNLAALLRERGIDFDSVEYHVTGLTEDELRGDRAVLARPVERVLELLGG